MANGIEVRQCFTLNATPGELYAFWRRFSKFPLFMRHVVSVTEAGPNRSHWVVNGPAGRAVEWDAEIVEEIPDRLIRWRTIGDPDVRHGGRVEFRPATGGRGTVADVHLAFEAPGGSAGANLVGLFGEKPELQIREDLRRFKRLVETGELPTTVGQSSGRDADDRTEDEKSDSERDGTRVPVGAASSREARS